MRFEVLEQQVSTIFGMPFLEATNPVINWKKKSIKIKHKGKFYDVPTQQAEVVQTSQPSSPTQLAHSQNSFQDLPVDEFDASAHIIDVDTVPSVDISNSADVVLDAQAVVDHDAAVQSISTDIASVPIASVTHDVPLSAVDVPSDSAVRTQTVSSTNGQQLDALLAQCTSLHDMLAVCRSFDAQGEAAQADPATNELQISSYDASCHVEQVQLHTFMRGMRKNQYRQAFVMVGSDITSNQNQTPVTCSSTNFDVSSVHSRVIEQCNLVGGVQSAVGALQYACENKLPVASLTCPSCNFPYADTASTFSATPCIHVCANPQCRKKFRNSNKAFGTPLAAYTVQGNVVTPKPSAQLHYTHRHAHGESGQSDKTNLTALAESTMQMLQRDFGSVFKEPTYPISRPEHMQHKITLTDPTAPPPKRRLYPLADNELQELKTQIESFLATNRIVPSSSPYGAPILFAKKKDGRLRMCLDYRALNSNTVPDSFPLPRIDELLSRLQGAKYFSKLDLRDGYHQIPVHEESRSYTAFTCRYGTFEWHVMPFGLCNAPGTFQRVMNHVFFDLLDRGVLVYLDDILIYSRTQEEHVALLRDVFALLQKHQLYLKESKCALFLEQVEFLGHVISAQGISVETGKTDAIRDWPAPTCLTEVQQFLGLANYYRKFIHRFSDIVQPLTSLTRKNVLFSWTTAQQLAFDKLKSLLCNAPILQVFDTALPTRVICDASDFAIGSVLEQQHASGDWHPVEFLSKSLNSAERNYSATDREFVAVRYSLEKWQHLLTNRKFTIYTDHAALTYLQSSSHVSRRNARWLEFLSQFSFDMLHVKGDSNIADHLSRISSLQPAQLQQLGSYISVFDESALMDAIKHAQHACKEPWYQKLIAQAETSRKVALRNNIYCYLVDDYYAPIVPTEAGIVPQILRDLHASSLGGHLGFKKLYPLVKRRFYWHNQRAMVDSFCKHCVTCQQQKVQTVKPAGLLQPLPVPSSPFESISMDFITHLPPSSGYDAIFTIVDRFSKFVKFVPIVWNASSAPTIARLLFEQWICLFGMPRSIVSDRDVRFTSAFWKALMQLLQCKQAMSSAYHPQTDGQTERFNRSVEQVLRCYTNEDQTNWSHVLQQCSFALNSSVHQGTSHSPFYVVFLRHPHLPIEHAAAACQDQKVEAVEQLVRRRSAVHEAVARHLTAANEAATRYHNKHRRHLEFSAEDLVMLNTKNLPLPSTLSRKLAMKWLGPIPVMERVGAVAYRLRLPASLAKLHDVFHVSLLKPFNGSDPGVRAPVFTAEGEEEFEVERLIGHRTSRGRKEYLVEWKGFPSFEATWEPLSNLRNAPEVVKAYQKANELP